MNYNVSQTEEQKYVITLTDGAVQQMFVPK